MTAATRYRVTGTFVNVKTNTTNGPMVVGLYEGAPVPADATPEWIEHHLVNHLIEEIPQAAPQPPEAKAPPGPAPRQASEAARAAETRAGVKGA